MAADPGAPVRPAAASGEISKRTMVISAAVLVVVLVLGVAIVAVTSDDGARQGRSMVDGELPAAEAIPQPGSGTAPEAPGDRGGSEQLGLFAVMAAAMAGIGAVIFRGGRKARANRARWLAAGASGHDGAVDPDHTRQGP